MPRLPVLQAEMMTMMMRYVSSNRRSRFHWCLDSFGASGKQGKLRQKQRDFNHEGDHTRRRAQAARPARRDDDDGHVDGTPNATYPSRSTWSIISFVYLPDRAGVRTRVSGAVTL